MQFEGWSSPLIGEWQGTKQLYFEPPPAPAISSASSLSARSVAGGRFLQFDYSWTYECEQQTGLLLVGYDEDNAASAAWVDSFHASSKILFCTGTAASGTVDVRGSYPAPPGPDWGWRIQIRSTSAREFQIVMHNISPEGQEDLAVQIDSTRNG